jgi:hypothetical protein
VKVRSQPDAPGALPTPTHLSRSWVETRRDLDVFVIEKSLAFSGNHYTHRDISPSSTIQLQNSSAMPAILSSHNMFVSVPRDRAMNAYTGTWWQWCVSFQSLYEEVSGLTDVLSVFPLKVQTPVFNVELVDRKANSA